LTLAHEILARKGRNDAAVLWGQAFARIATQVVGQYEQELARLEKHHGIRLRTVADRVGERFVQSLAVDRMCALIGPAMEEARGGRDAQAFTRLEQNLAAQMATPVGVGLDVPPWLRRLEAEVHRVQASRSAVNVLAEQQLRVPQRVVSVEDLHRQVREWEEPLTE
jgi:hypothetical protein